MDAYEVLQNMQADKVSIDILAEYLGYEVGKDPINPASSNQILFSKRIQSHESGVIACVPVEDLNNETSTVGVRKLFQEVLNLKDYFGTSFDVAVVALVGQQRIVFFPSHTNNRDERLDLNLETIDRDLYVKNLDFLKDENIEIKEDPFGFTENTIEVSKSVFRKELTTHFLSVVSFYRKKLSELITGSNLKQSLTNLVDDQAKVYLHRNDLNNLVQNDSYTSVLSMVVDTIILRQLMRRFLEGYYGADSFEVDGIALGIGSGTMDEAIKNAVDVASQIGDEDKIKKLNRHETEIQVFDILSDAFTEEEKRETSQIKVKENKAQYIADVTRKYQDQFKVAYDGDLFAGSVGKAADEIEKQLADEYPEFMAKLWVDTASGNYSFRYEDMPPVALEKQYEDSMSQSVQLKIDSETNKPVVFYGDDDKEQKDKGAYYTDERFVNYMVNQTVYPAFNERYQAVKVAIKDGDENQIKAALDYLFSLKVADFTVGGGSFLRGAFNKLANQHQLLANLKLPESIKSAYPQLANDDEGQYQWEKYILDHMLYGVDIDYKAIIIASLTLTLSSLQNRPKDTKLPQLIGRTLIHQNALMNSVPYYRREEVFGKYQSEISQLIKLKQTDFVKFNQLRRKLQNQVLKEAGPVSSKAALLHIEAIELNLPEVFFNDDGTLNEHGGMDVIIGNPPWEVWKPNSDEFFSQYDSTYLQLKNKKAKKQREKELIAKIPFIKDRWEQEQDQIKLGSEYFRSNAVFKYQSWMVEGRKASSDINLYKISIERFLQLATNKVRMSILVPDNLATDNGSTGLRHLLFENYHVTEFLSFENRKGIFPAVDGRYKFAVLNLDCEQPQTDNFKAFFYRQDLASLTKEEHKLHYDLATIKKYQPERLSLFESKTKAEYDLYIKISNRYRSIAESKLLTFIRDFDKSNDSDKFQPYHGKPGEILLYEGKLMGQFTIKLPNEFETLKSTVAPECVDETVVKEKIGELYHSYRIVFRSVANSTNMRSMIATLLPPETTFAHSLTGQRNVEMPLEDKLFTLGMLNSYVIDYVLRKLITTNVSQTYVKQLPIPMINEVADSDQIIQIVKVLLMENSQYYQDLATLIPGNEYAGMKREELLAELNARVMLDFDLTRADIVELMKSFESSNHLEEVKASTQAILDKYDELKGNV